MITALGGNISVDSVVGEWSAFTVDFPFNDPPADIPRISRSLKNAHVFFVCNDLLHTQYVTGVFRRYSVDFTHYQSMKEIVSTIDKGTVPKDRLNVCLVDEDIFDDDSFELIKRATNCTLTTFGPKFSVKRTVSHYRDLVHVLPSVFMQKLGALVSSAQREMHLPVALQPAPEIPFSSLRVLIAEDNKINQKVLGRILEKMGIEQVVVVDDGRKAVEWEAEHPVDFILMDYQMVRRGRPQNIVFAPRQIYF